MYDPSTAEEKLTISVRKATEFLDQTVDNNCLERYPMRSCPRGLVLLISLIKYENINSDMKDRAAAVHDETNLIMLFEQMGFKVIAEADLTTNVSNNC